MREFYIFQGDLMSRYAKRSNTLVKLTQWFSKKDSDQLWEYLYSFMKETNKTNLPISVNTTRAYKRHFRYFCEWAFEQDIELVLDPTRDFLLEYFDYRRKANPDLSPESFGQVRSPVVKFYDALLTDKIIDFNMVTSISGNRQQYRRDPNNTFTEEEIQSLMRVSTESITAAILLGARLGMRIEEIVSLKWTDIDLNASKVRVNVQSNKKEWIGISGDLLDILIALKSNDQESDVVVVYTQAKTIRKKFSEACNRAGVDIRGRTFSGLRNTWHEAQRQLFVTPKLPVGNLTLSLDDIHPPRFEDLTQDARIHAILYDRWYEAVRMYNADALRFTVVALGAVFEGALVALLNKHKKKIDMKSNPPNTNGVPKDVKDWKFTEMIDYAQKDSVGWLHEFNGEYADRLRDYRNFVHPALELNKRSKIENRLCRNLFGATKHMINDLIRSQSK